MAVVEISGLYPNVEIEEKVSLFSIIFSKKVQELKVYQAVRSTFYII